MTHTPVVQPAQPATNITRRPLRMRTTARMTTGPPRRVPAAEAEAEATAVETEAEDEIEDETPFEIPPNRFRPPSPSVASPVAPVVAEGALTDTDRWIQENVAVRELFRESMIRSTEELRTARERIFNPTNVTATRSIENNNNSSSSNSSYRDDPAFRRTIAAEVARSSDPVKRIERLQCIGRSLETELYSMRHVVRRCIAAVPALSEVDGLQLVDSSIAFADSMSMGLENLKTAVNNRKNENNQSQPKRKRSRTEEEQEEERFRATLAASLATARRERITNQEPASEAERLETQLTQVRTSLQLQLATARRERITNQEPVSAAERLETQMMQVRASLQLQLDDVMHMRACCGCTQVRVYDMVSMPCNNHLFCMNCTVRMMRTPVNRNHYYGHLESYMLKCPHCRATQDLSVANLRFENESSARMAFDQILFLRKQIRLLGTEVYPETVRSLEMAAKKQCMWCSEEPFHSIASYREHLRQCSANHARPV